MTLKIIILYQELAFYTLRCIEALASEHGVEIHMVSKPVNKEAPFKFETNNSRIHFYNRDKYDMAKLQKLVNTVSPNLIYCAGWIDKEYLQLVKNNKKDYNTLLGFDNQWLGTLKQRLATIYGRLFLKPHFKYSFVPGAKQKAFAQKLGFRNENIITGAYSADISTFNEYYNPNKKHHNTFLYVGRYVQQKNIEMLWQAFIEILPEIGNDWKLICAGTGNIAPINHSNIIHKGFVQPKDFQNILNESNIYILPSCFEPWGVSVHEMACAGFPMILSEKVGASEVFLEEGKNGFLFNPNDKEALKQKMKQMVTLSANELQKMREQSHSFGQRITPSTWADQLMSAMKRT